MLASGSPQTIEFNGQRWQGPPSDGTHGQVLTTDGAGHLYMSTPSGGGGSGDLNFTFVQNAAASTWTIVHNLGKFPSVTVIDSASTPVIGTVHYVNDASLTITFSAAFSGTAYLN